MALITGGGSGIGLAMARVFAGTGYTVLITGRDRSRLQRAVQELTSARASISALPCDVSDPQAVENLFSEIGAKF
ncbi:MAG TPA: SDR family NAD(P)-dependent oxidoreductase, partial [Terriglobales bacterium]